LATATSTFNAAKTAGTKVVVVDKTTLTAAITAANTNVASVTVSTNGADVLPANQWVTSVVKTAYSNAIGAAQAVVDNTAATQTDVSNAVTTLATATSTFNAAKTAGTATAIVGISVKDYGNAKGDGVTDDTAAINNTIDYVSSLGGGTVYVPDGTYLVNPDVSVNLKSNITLNLSSNATLQAKASANSYYDLIRILEATNVNVVGGKIVGDRNIHQGTTGEWGSGISILGSNGVTISDIAISDCWGDGIFIDGSWDNSILASSNVTIARVDCNNNRRQGISVISAKDLTVRDSQLNNSNGTAPQSGIDLEPDNSSQFLQNILIDNVTCQNNANIGIAVALTNWNGSTSDLSITINNCTATASPYPICLYKYNESPTCKITMNGDTGSVYSWN
jgi:polygalacturonase